jgi:hypothetical protein
MKDGTTDGAQRRTRSEIRARRVGEGIDRHRNPFRCHGHVYIVTHAMTPRKGRSASNLTIVQKIRKVFLDLPHCLT